MLRERTEEISSDDSKLWPGFIAVPLTDDVSVICALGLRSEFPDAVIRNCDDICGDGTIEGSSSAHELDDLYRVDDLSDVFKDSFTGKGKRLDLRDIVTFTIDGDDSGDFKPDSDGLILFILSRCVAGIRFRRRFHFPVEIDND